jgi:hypothetical protein
VSHESSRPALGVSPSTGPVAGPAGRYGSELSRGRRRARLAGVVVLAAAGLAWVGWVGLDRAGQTVRWSQVGFVIGADADVQVTYDVGKDPPATVVCRLRALSRSKATVGLVDVVVGPADRRVTRRTDTVRTSGLAVTGVVDSCRPG